MPVSCRSQTGKKSMTNVDESEIYLISAGQCFNFRCDPAVSCFNACCGDLNQYLSPYDVMRLKKALNVNSSVFLETWTNRHDGPRSGLPVVSLRPQAGPDLKCPFVTPEGCGVYVHRPASCRMYPVMRMAARDRVTGHIRESYHLICEPHCRGFATDRKLTLDRWIDEQGLHPYNAANDAFLDVISAKRQKHPDVLEKHNADSIYTVLYDSDTFMADSGKHLFKDNAGFSSDQTDVSDQAYLSVAYKYVIDCF